MEALKFIFEKNFVNLKKTSGGSSSNPSVISAYAKNDKVLLLKQIEISAQFLIHIILGGLQDL